MQNSRTRQAYTHGTAARRMQAQPARRHTARTAAPAPRRAPAQRRVPQQPRTYKKVEVRYEMHPQVQQQRKQAFRLCTMVALIFVMLVAVVASKAISAQINLENIAIRENILSLEEQIEQTNLAIATECDIQQVAEVAEDSLSMGFPGDSQVYYVELEQEQPAQPEVTEPEGNVLENIQEWFLGIDES